MDAELAQAQELEGDMMEVEYEALGTMWINDDGDGDNSNTYVCPSLRPRHENGNAD